MYVCYRFSRQPLNRLFWNFAWCFEMGSERQLSILEPIGWIINELSHNSCMKKRSQYATLRNDETNVWRHQCQCVGFVALQLTSCNYILSDVRNSGSVSNGLHSMWRWRNISFAKKGHRESGISQRTQLVYAPGSRDSLGMSGNNSLYLPVKNERGTDTGVIVVSTYAFCMR